MYSKRPFGLPGFTRRAATAALSAAALVTGGLIAVAPSVSAATQADSAQPANTQRLCAQPTKAGVMSCLALARTDMRHHLGISPNATPSGYGPTDLQSAYKLPASGGAGRPWPSSTRRTTRTPSPTWPPTARQFGLPACTTANGCFKKVDQNGGTNYPTADSGWAGEISLDLDMVSAVCPQLPHPARRGQHRQHGRPGHRGEPRGRHGRQVRLQQLRRQRGLHRHRAPTPPTSTTRASPSPPPPVTAATASSTRPPPSTSPPSAAPRSAARRNSPRLDRDGLGHQLQQPGQPAPAAPRTTPSRPGRPTPAAPSAPSPTSPRSPTPPPASRSTTRYQATRLGRLRRHQRLLADHRRRLRPRRHPGREHLPGVLPVRPHRLAERRHLAAPTAAAARATCAPPGPATTARPASAPRTAPRPSPAAPAPATPSR